jgi:hypothetical protein
MFDHEAMLEIQQVLDGVEWTADTLDCIARILLQAGYRIRDLDDRDLDDREAGTIAELTAKHDPTEPAAVKEAGHVLAVLREDEVRESVVALLEEEHDFGDLTLDAVTPADIHSACRSVAAAIDLSEQTGDAAFRAALIALDEAGRRRTQEKAGIAAPADVWK